MIWPRTAYPGCGSRSDSAERGDRPRLPAHRAGSGRTIDETTIGGRRASPASGEPADAIARPAAYDLGLVGGGHSHASSPPSPIMLFAGNRFSRVRSATTSLSACVSRRESFTSSDVAARAVSPANRRFPGHSRTPSTSHRHRRGDAFAAAQLGDAVVPAQTLQHDADFALRQKSAAASRDPDVLDRVFRPALYPARISVSSSLLAATR